MFFSKAELFHNVRGNLGSGCGSEGKDGNIGKTLAKFGYPKV